MIVWLEMLVPQVESIAVLLEGPPVEYWDENAMVRLWGSFSWCEAVLQVNKLELDRRWLMKEDK